MGFTFVLDCTDPDALAEFWAPALGYKNVGTEGPYVVLISADGASPGMLLQRVPEGKAGKNRMHLDIHTDDMEGEVARLTELGARPVGEEVDESDCRWTVMTDPEGNEFCVCLSKPF